MLKCNKPGHIKPNCPKLKKKNSKDKSKKALVAGWMDSDDSSSDNSSDKEVAHICLMALGEDKPESSQQREINTEVNNSDSLSIEDYEEAFAKLYEEYKQRQRRAARKRKERVFFGSEPSAKKKKMEKAPASKPFVQQNIFEPRYIKWDSFSDLPYEFEDLFTFQGWMEFSELNEYYYPYLIQEFYGSMKEVVKGESFSVRIKKKSQIVDVEFLASVLNLPNDGNRIGTFKDSRKLEGYDEKAFQLSIFPEGTPENEMTNISLVPQNFRILQSFIRYLLNPRSGSHSYANSLDLCIMWHLVNKIRFNLPFLIFKVIAKSSKHRRLPYAMPLTLIFQAMGVDLSKEKNNAKATGPSGVKISEVEEEAEEHVEAAEKVQEESKLAEVEEVEKNHEKEKSAEEASETEQEPANETSRESSSSHTTSNSSSDNGKSEGRNGSRQEEEKEEQSQDPSSEQPNIESTISLPMQYGPRRTKTQARKSVLPIPPKIQVPITEKEPPKKKTQAKLVDPTHLRRSGRILSSKEKS
ncbi:hypothetical protein P3X46_026975 [Hevea brasiliensis]|uniref:CCHC-type domain-containing protein n=1 Tax=Hevea brasiliensis TaxID=3981 RepID=A0ABQ9KYD6_HEVBR|nr:hypothetical protein P3X46_026975 [Hevea brasiliensis]